MQNPRPSSFVVMLSAGLDSAVNLLMAREYGMIDTAVTVNYGQRSALRELRKAADLCESVGIEHLAIDAEWVGVLSRDICALFPDGPALPEMDARELEEAASSETAGRVWVPNRNGLLANIGACVAEARRVDQVLMGFNREEAATFPDNSGMFVSALNEALEFSTLSGVRIASFTINMSKPEIFEAAIDLGLDLGLVWSCYDGADLMCGRCESCARLARAAHAAGCGHLVENLFDSGS